MANGLTGDFDAVVQVNARTVQRLLAYLHRNDRADPSVPTMPHHVDFRLDVGDTHGQVTAQVGVPIVELINGSTDTFRLKVGVRARFVADEGSDPLGEFIHGTIGANYRMEPVDPNCMGWAQAAADHVWLRVARGSVTFDGTVRNPGVFGAQVDTPEVHDRIRNLLELLLTSRFEATPHRVSAGFRPGHLVELVRNEGSAVAIPVGLDGGIPPGSVHSIAQVYAGERDVALAVSRDVIVGRVQQVLDDLRQSFHQTIRLQFKATVAFWDIVDVDISWGVRIDSATARWVGPTSQGGGVDIDVHLAGGGYTQKPEYDWGFEVDQRIHLKVDARSGWVGATPGGEPSVALRYDGPFADEAKSAAAPQVTTMIRQQVQSATGSVSADLGLTARAEGLSRQLRSLDPAANVAFEWTKYVDDGIILIGNVALSGQGKGGEVRFEKWEEGSGYRGVSSWMPGGRIDTYAWSWSWHDGSRPPGSKTVDDRWLLQLDEYDVPAGITVHGGHGGGVSLTPTTFGPDGLPLEGRSVFGQPEAIDISLPGYGGNGRMKLDVTGVLVDDESGELVPFFASSEPIDYTLPIGIITHRTPNVSTTAVHHGVVVHGWELGVGGPDGGRGYTMGGFATTGFATTSFSNIFVVRPGIGISNQDLAARIGAGLAGATVEGAGLHVLVLHPENRAEPAVLVDDAQVYFGAMGALAPTFVSADVDGTWAEALGLPDDTDTTVMALVTPNGGTAWMYLGEPDSIDLSGVLDAHLVPSAPPGYEAVTQGIRVDDILTPWALYVGSDRSCPPPPVGRLGVRSVITFLRPGSPVNGRTLDTVKRLGPDPADVLTAVVVQGPAVDGAPLRDAGLGGDAVPIADPEGELARRFGIRAWPTTLLVDEFGRVTKVLVGADEPAAPSGTPERTEVQP